MFSRYWGDRYFAPRYWPNDGDVIVTVEPTSDTTVIVRGRARTIVVQPDPQPVVNQRPREVVVA